jgi:hypothetical protein
MTIECHGHVVSLSQSTERDIGKQGVAVTIQLESRRCIDRITLHADRDEVGSYYPGMAMVLQLRPAP